jgi:triacylglycerol lipase
MSSIRVVALLLFALSPVACSRGEEPGAASAGECVVLLHGLARTSLSMERMKASLEEEGYRVVNIDYPSREYRIEELAPMAVEAGLAECGETSSRVHFVTHSLGGILVRHYFANHELDRLGRVVMLGPPNQGTDAVDTLRDVPGFDWLNGPAGYELGKGDESVPRHLPPPNFEFAVIAGDRTIDPITSAVLDDPDDGRVSVDDTRLEGMADFRIVGASHAFMMQKSDVIRLVKRFLASGSFDEPGT